MSSCDDAGRQDLQAVFASSQGMSVKNAALGHLDFCAKNLEVRMWDAEKVATRREKTVGLIGQFRLWRWFQS